MKKHGIPRAEKLKNRSDIGLLFEEGKWKNCGKIKLISMHVDNRDDIKIGFSVSKRHFKHAVDRNRIKRLLREVYRLNKDLFIENQSPNNIYMLFWSDKKMPKNYFEVLEQFKPLIQQK